MRSNAKAVACDICDQFVHIKCGNISDYKYNKAVKLQSEVPLVCNVCCLQAVPNIGLIDESMDMCTSKQDQNETAIRFAK